MDVLGNRGKCAQPCRLPYDLLEGDNKIDSGYLLSPRDLCGLDYLSRLIDLGIESLKIEGRMKTPDYVATVTRIYRKYIDNPHNIDENDRKDLLQVFNRGNFSSGHFLSSENRDLVFSDKQNNMGLYLGNVSNYNSKKGHIKIDLNDSIAIGDTISIDGETGEYTISEIIDDNKNLKSADGKTVILGRMKGNIKIGSKVYKMSSKLLTNECRPTYKENTNLIRIPINVDVSVKQKEPITVSINVKNHLPFYENISVKYISNIIPEHKLFRSTSKDRIIEQFSKLGNTPYYIDNINIDLDKSICIPHISDINTIRREAIKAFESEVINKFNYRAGKLNYDLNTNHSNKKYSKRKLSVLLEQINPKMDYSSLEKFDNLYIPLKFFTQSEYQETLNMLSKKYNMYIYMPTIMKSNYKNLLLSTVDDIIKDYKIKGFVISNIAGFKFLEKYADSFELVSNYTMNVFNSHTINELRSLGANIVTPSVELNSEMLNDVTNNSSLPVELIAYGRAVLMNTAYCLLGKSNKCYPECEARCRKNKKYYLKDRYGYKFRVLPDNVQTVTAIYNSKIASIETEKYNVYSVRINILDENINEINKIIKKVKSGSKLEGTEYTNGNLKRDI